MSDGPEGFPQSFDVPLAEHQAGFCGKDCAYCRDEAALMNEEKGDDGRA